MGRSKTAFQVNFGNVHDHRLRTVAVENETWNFVTRGKKNIDIQVGKMFKCTDPGMQDIIIRGKDTSVLKFSVGYHMTSEADGIDLFN